MDDLVEHFQKGTFQEQYWLPAHNERRNSVLFRKNKKFIRDECGAPCWVCGAKKDLEVHHVFEWAFWNAMDPKKVTNILCAIEFYDDDFIDSSKEPAKIRNAIRKLNKEKKFVDSPDDLRNLVVLCREHHRLKFTGVHTVSFPLWMAIAAVPIKGGVLTREQLLIAVNRVKSIDEELAGYAENNYKSQRN